MNKNPLFLKLALFVSALLCFVPAVLFRRALAGWIFAGAGCLILALLGLSLLEKRLPCPARILRRALLIFFGFCLLCFAAIEIPIILAARTDKDPQAEYIIVLGAGVYGTVPSASLVERLQAARDYLERYPGSAAIVSGGQGPGEDITEAEAMRVWLERQGVSPDRIIKEEESSNTLENIAFSLDIIYSRGGDTGGRVAIVSSEYHLFRAKQIAGSFGATPLGVAAKTENPALRANYFAREGFAVAYMWVFGINSQIMDAMLQDPVP